MASITDIPDELLNLAERNTFLLWLRNLPTDDMTKKELLFLWAEYVGYHVTTYDMEIVFGEDYRTRGI